MAYDKIIAEAKRKIGYLLDIPIKKDDHGNQIIQTFGIEGVGSRRIREYTEMYHETDDGFRDNFNRKMKEINPSIPELGRQMLLFLAFNGKKGFADLLVKRMREYYAANLISDYDDVLEHVEDSSVGRIFFRTESAEGPRNFTVNFEVNNNETFNTRVDIRQSEETGQPDLQIRDSLISIRRNLFPSAVQEVIRDMQQNIGTDGKLPVYPANIVNLGPFDLNKLAEGPVTDINFIETENLIRFHFREKRVPLAQVEREMKYADEFIVDGDIL